MVLFVLMSSAVRERSDKLLSEVSVRTFGESLRERQGAAKLYCGALAVAKIMPAGMRQQFLNRNCAEGYERLAAGS